MELKAGDWVLLTYRYDNCTTTTIEKYMWENINRYGFNSSYSKNGRNSAEKDRATLEHWQPKVGDKVVLKMLFDNDFFKVFTVKEIIEGTIFSANGSSFDIKQCEPFIGELPSFIKES
jgi:hypothetical protein